MIDKLKAGNDINYPFTSNGEQNLLDRGKTASLRSSVMYVEVRVEQFPLTIKTGCSQWIVAL